MDNRSRNEQLKIYLTPEEKALFEQKQKLARCRTMSLFLRKCVLEKEIYIVDLEPFRRLEGLLSNIATNVNQIAKVANATGLVEVKDIYEIRTEIDRLGKEILDIHELILKRGKEASVSK